MDFENNDTEKTAQEAETQAEQTPVREPSVLDESPTKPTVTFMGNSYDLMSVVGVTLAGGTLFACGTCGFGFYCLPFIPVILGVVGLLSLKDSVDPNRTKLFSWISIITGSIFVLLILGLVLFYVLYFGFVFSMIAAEGGVF